MSERGEFQTIKDQEDREADEAYPKNEGEYEGSHEVLSPLTALIV